MCSNMDIDFVIWCAGHAGGSAWVMNEKNCHKAREMLVLGTLNVD